MKTGDSIYFSRQVREQLKATSGDFHTALTAHLENVAYVAREGDMRVLQERLNRSSLSGRFVWEYGDWRLEYSVDPSFAVVFVHRAERIAPWDSGSAPMKEPHSGP